MRLVVGIVLVIDVYVIVYYRLLVKHYYEQAHDIKEGAVGALFSLPPYSRLPAKGQRYARRYWLAVAVLVACIGVLAATTDFSPLWAAFG